MMTTEELQERLDKIDISLVIRETNTFPHSKPLGIVYISAPFEDDHVIYNFTNQKYDEENCLKFIPTKIHDLNKLLDEYYEGRKEILASDSENSVDSTDPEKPVIEPAEIADNHNPFKKYTDKLAEILQEKNDDYGDSFSMSVDKFGIIAAVVRLEDKFNRLENLTANGDKEKVKDESLADTALDISGYGLLLYKYLKEHERTSK